MLRFVRLKLVAGAALVLTLQSAALIQPDGQTVEIRVLFLNGNTGQALRNTQVVAHDNSADSNLGQPKILLTDADGIVRIAVEPGSLVRAFVDRYYIRSCEDSSIAGQRLFDANQIIATGIVEKSTCKMQSPPAEPGLLVRIVRKSTFREALGEN